MSNRRTLPLALASVAAIVIAGLPALPASAADSPSVVVPSGTDLDVAYAKALATQKNLPVCGLEPTSSPSPSASASASLEPTSAASPSATDTQAPAPSVEPTASASVAPVTDTPSVQAAAADVPAVQETVNPTPEASIPAAQETVSPSPEASTPAPVESAAPSAAPSASPSASDLDCIPVTAIDRLSMLGKAVSGDESSASVGVNTVDFPSFLSTQRAQSFETPAGSLSASPAQILSNAEGSTAQVVTVSRDNGTLTVDVTPALPKAQASAVISKEQADPSTVAVSVAQPVHTGGRRDTLPITPYQLSASTSTDPQRATQNRMYDFGSSSGWYNYSSWKQIEYPWQFGRGNGITVAVIDTGVDGTHPDLAGQVLPGFDFAHDAGYASFTPGWQADHPHGTHVAGIIAAKDNNAVGITGLAPDVKILPIKVLNASGSGSSGTVAQGVVAAVDAGAQVINLSLGSPDPDAALEAAIAYAVAQGVVVVAAGGNLGMPGYITLNGMNYPAGYPGVIGVASAESDCGGVGGTHIDVSAPGCSVLSTIPGTSYAQYSGTSMATPQVAAEAALLLSAGAASSQVESLIVGNTILHASLLAFTCVNAPDWTPTNNHTICTPAGIDEVKTGKMYGSGTIQISDALLAAKSQSAYAEGSAWTAASAPAPVTPPAPSSSGGGASSGGSAPAPSAGGSSGGGSAPSAGGSSGGGASSGGGGGGSMHEITGLRPASGPLAGGNTIAIVGYGFTGVREVRIGDKLTSFTFVNDAHIEAVVPAGDKLGSADVSVVLAPEVGRAFAPGGYVYTSEAAPAPAPAPVPSTGTPVSIPEKPFTPSTRPMVTVAGPRVVVTAPAGAKSTVVQKKAKGKWATLRRVPAGSASLSLTASKGQYRVVSTLASGQSTTRTFTIR